jgi:hypothetical protein
MTELSSKNSCDNVRLNKHGTKSKWFRTKSKDRKDREYQKKVSLRQIKTNLTAEQCDAADALVKYMTLQLQEEENDRLYFCMLLDMLE